MYYQIGDMMKKIITLVLLIMLVACTTPSPDVPEQPTQNQVTEPTTNEPTGDDSPVAMPQAAPDNSDVKEMVVEPEKVSDDVYADFAQALNSLPEYYVKYEITGTNMPSTMSQYLKKSKMRSDVTTEGIEARSFIVDKVITSCTNQGSWQCYQINSAETAVNNGLDNIKENIEDYKSKVTKEPSRTILGMKTECFKVTDDKGWYIYCWNSKFTPLFIGGTQSNQEWSMTAIDYKESVADSVFDLPAAPQDLDAMMKNLQQIPR